MYCMEYLSDLKAIRYMDWSEEAVQEKVQYQN